MPATRQIGLLAPLLVFDRRLLQVSSVMDLGGVSVYLSEIATPGHKNFTLAGIWHATSLPGCCAAVVGVDPQVRLIERSGCRDGDWRFPPCSWGLLYYSLLFRLEIFSGKKKLDDSCTQIIGRTPRGRFFFRGKPLAIVLVGTSCPMTTVSFYHDYSVYAPFWKFRAAPSKHAA